MLRSAIMMLNFGLHFLKISFPPPEYLKCVIMFRFFSFSLFRGYTHHIWLWLAVSKPPKHLLNSFSASSKLQEAGRLEERRRGKHCRPLITRKAAVSPLRGRSVSLYCNSLFRCSNSPFALPSASLRACVTDRRLLS